MANIPNQLHLLAAYSVFSLLPSALFPVAATPTTVPATLVASRLIPSTRQVSELAHENATLHRRVSVRKKALKELVEGSDRAHIADAKTPLDAGDPSSQPPAPAPAVDSEAESERLQALEVRRGFLRDSFKIVFAQKNDLLAQQNEDLATLKGQLATTHQTKNEVLAEKDASCEAILAQKNEEIASRNMVLSQMNDELAALKAHLAAAKQTMATITAARDKAVARTRTVADELEKTRADCADAVTSLTTQTTDAETNPAALRTIFQQQKTEISDILFKKDDLNAELTRVRDLYDSVLEYCKIQERNNAKTIAEQGVEIAMLTRQLEAASRQRAVPASPRYNFQSFMSRRSSDSESESDSSFDSDKPSSPRWRRFIIRRARKAGKP